MNALCRIIISTVHLKAKQGEHNRRLVDWRVYYDQDEIATMVKAIVVNLHLEAT